MPRNVNPTGAQTPRQWRAEARAELDQEATIMTDKTDLNGSTSLRAVTFDVPLQNGDQTIDGVTVRKPASGELRGLTMMALSQLDYTALETLLPRITMPVLSKQMIARLDPADFMQLGGEVMDFLLPKSAKATDSPTT
jgi:hypothetical protein